MASLYQNDYVEALEDSLASTYRRVTGMLMWLTPIRPDINYAVKELTRGLQAPTKQDYNKLKHLLRYLRGTEDYALAISPKSSTTVGEGVELQIHVDSDWAGCSTTRKSTTGVLISLWGCAIHHVCRTQKTIATSSA